MTDTRMIKEFLVDGARYLFDGILIAFVWSFNHIHLLNVDTLWAESFGSYADTAKKSFQVIITILIAFTAFYRLRREILKYRNEKKASKKDQNS